VITCYIVWPCSVHKTNDGKYIVCDVVNLICSKTMAATIANFLTTYNISNWIYYKSGSRIFKLYELIGIVNGNI